LLIIIESEQMKLFE